MLMKTYYLKPTCEIIVMQPEPIMQVVSGYSEAGSPISTNATSPYYNHIETGIQPIGGGAPHARSSNTWKPVGQWN